MPTLAFPNRCRHCDPAPCLQVCPTGAISRDDELRAGAGGAEAVHRLRHVRGGLPLRRHHLPSPGRGARRRRWRSPSSATAASNGSRRGEEPACAEVCKVDALVFGELNELVAAGSLRETGAVLAAAGVGATPLPEGDPLAGWRAWGAAERAAADAASTLGDEGTGTAARPSRAGPTREDHHDHHQRARPDAPADHQRGRPGDDRRGPGGGDRHRLGPPGGPAAPVRLLRARAELSQLRHGPVPHRPLRRGAPEGGVRGRTPTSSWPATWAGPSPPGRRRTPTTAGTSSRRSVTWPAGETTGYQIADEAQAAPPGRARSAWRPRAATLRRSPSTSPTCSSRTTARRRGSLSFVGRVPEVRRATGGRQLGITPRGIDRENVEMLHRTHMGVDNDYVNTLLHALRTGLADGWGGSMIATELSDVMFGTPKPVMSEVNLGVLQDRPSEHRHARPQPVALRRDLAAAAGPRAAGAGPLLRRHRHQRRRAVLHRQRDADAPGRADGRQPPDAGAGARSPARSRRWSSTTSASCRRSSTWRSATTRRSSRPRTRRSSPARPTCRSTRSTAPRSPIRSCAWRSRPIPTATTSGCGSPASPVQMMGGFSVEAILGALGGTPKPLVDAIAAGTIRGAVAVVGLQQPEAPPGPRAHRAHPSAHRERHPGAGHRVRGGGQRQGGADGSRGGRHGRSGPPVGVRGARHPPGAAHGELRGQQPDHGPGGGPGGLPRRRHRPAAAGRCRARSGTPRRRWPSAPTWSASGITTVLGVQPPIFGSPHVVDLLANGLDDVVGAKFVGGAGPGEGRAVDPPPHRGQAPGSRPAVRRHRRRWRSTTAAAARRWPSASEG